MLDYCRHFHGAPGTSVEHLVMSLLGFEAKEGCLFILGRDLCVTHSLGFTSGVRHAGLLAASRAILCTSEQALVGLGIYYTTVSQRETRQMLI